MNGVVVGIDVGGTKIAGVLVSRVREVVANATDRTNRLGSPDHIAELLAALVSAGYTHERIL